MKIYSLKYLQDRKGETFDEFFNSEDFKKKFDISSEVITSDIIKIAFNNFRISQFSDYFLIFIDQNLKLSRINNLTIDQLCRLINYGTADIAGWPIFEDTFQYIKDNIDSLYETYKAGIIL